MQPVFIKLLKKTSKQVNVNIIKQEFFITTLIKSIGFFFINIKATGTKNNIYRI